MKLSYQLLEKMNSDNLKPTRIELLIYLVKNQDNVTGRVYGVHHKDVKTACGMVRQSFYNALKDLEERDYIETKRHKEGYYTVWVKNNSYPELAQGKKPLKHYIDLQKKAFNSKKFDELKANEKLMMMLLYKRTHEGRNNSYEIGVEKFYDKYTNEFNVSKRAVRSYLHSLKEFFSAGIKDGKYYITYKHSVFRDKIDKPERLVRDESYVRQIVHKLKIRDTNDYEISQTAEFFHQYKQMAEEAGKDIYSAVFEVVEDTVKGILQKKRNLQYKLINIKLGKLLKGSEKPAEGINKENRTFKQSFDQRNYSSEEIKELERRLINKRNEKRRASGRMTESYV